MRIMAQSPIPRYVQIFSHEQRRHRENTSTQPFSDHQHIRHHVEMLTDKHFSGTANRGWNFIKNQKNAMFIANVTDAAPIILGRQFNARPTHGFGDQSPNITFHFYHIF